MSDPLSNFHNTMAGLLELEEDLSPIAKIVVLLRVTIEYGLQYLGVASLVHILSVMTEAAAEVSEDDATMHYEKLFDEIEEMSQSIH
jgi:hypothetical protein